MHITKLCTFSTYIKFRSLGLQYVLHSAPFVLEAPYEYSLRLKLVYGRYSRLYKHLQWVIQ